MADRIVHKHQRAGRWLRRKRLERGFRFQRDFGLALGMNQQQVSNYERGLSAVPEGYFPHMAKVLGITVTQLRTGLGMPSWYPETWDIAEVTNEELLREVARRVNEGEM